jgi:peroxiredoxin
MIKNLRPCIPVVVVLLLCWSVAWGGGRRDANSRVEDLGVGLPAPDFTLKDLEGNDITLHEYRGRVVVLSFWATWCPACRAEMPSLEALHRRMAEQGVVVLGVNGGEPVERVRDFMTNLRLSFPVAMDTDGRIHARYHIRQYPVTFIIDRKGRLVERHLGLRDWNAPEVVETLRTLAEKGLEGKP